ncbi:MAG: hypothetical protein ACI311_00245 [Bacilli bacterium]
MLLTQETGNIWVQIGILLVCIALFVGTYLLNKHTKKPEGCEEVSEHCIGCTITTCSHHPDNSKDNSKDKGEEKND